MTDYNASPAQPAPDSTAPAGNPGKTLGVVGLILGIVGFVIAFLAPIAGLIVSILGLRKSKKVGKKNGLALAGIIVSIIALIVNIVALVVLINLGGSAVNLIEQCQNDPTGVVEFQGEQIPCSQLLESVN